MDVKKDRLSPKMCVTSSSLSHDTKHYQGSHTDWKTWKNGETFFQSGKSQGILCRLEKSGKFGQNTGKVREI